MSKKSKNRGAVSRIIDDVFIEDEIVQLPVKNINKVRLTVGAGALLLLMVLLCFRLGYWQVVKSDELKIKAASMQTVDTEIDAQRGTIYDTNENVLAKSITEYELYGYTQTIYKDKSLSSADKEKTADELAKLTGISVKAAVKRLNSDENLVLLADGLSQKDIAAARKLWGDSIVVKTQVSRYYPNKDFAAQVLGSVNSENSGRTGLEYEYNSVLAGVKGRTVKTTDRNGNAVSNGSRKYYQPQDGSSIVTTLDSVIQNYVEEALEKGKQRTGVEKITCIVMDPKSGDVLAVAATPDYDPNTPNEPASETEKKAFEKMSLKQKNDYLSNMWTIDAISKIYEPGSTFKLITAAAALETNHATMNTTYYCPGYIDVNGTKLRCLFHHGTQNLKVAVGNSCNPALARAALDMGASCFYNYIDLFGFNEKTDIDLPGETNSIVKDPSTLGSVDLATTGFGQGIAVTPMQVLCAVNSFGNDGIMMKPKLVKRIVNSDGKTEKTYEDTEVRRVVSSETAEQMREIMEYYVSDAGGDQAYIAGYRIGGKTGTANIASGGGYSSATDTSFVAMAPMDNPVISMIVIVHKPTKVKYGNNTAGPIIKDIMGKSLVYLGVEKKYTSAEKATHNKNMVTVPDVTGIDSKKAIEKLKSSKLGYKVMPESSSNESFVVQDQYPKAGSKTSKNSKVYIYSE